MLVQIWGHLVGSVIRACDSWISGPEFKLYLGCGAYLKERKEKKKEILVQIELKNKNKFGFCE